MKKRLMVNGPCRGLRVKAPRDRRKIAIYACQHPRWFRKACLYVFNVDRNQWFFHSTIDGDVLDKDFKHTLNQVPFVREAAKLNSLLDATDARREKQIPQAGSMRGVIAAGFTYGKSKISRLLHKMRMNKMKTVN